MKWIFTDCWQSTVILMNDRRFGHCFGSLLVAILHSLDLTSLTSQMLVFLTLIVAVFHTMNDSFVVDLSFSLQCPSNLDDNMDLCDGWILLSGNTMHQLWRIQMDMMLLMALNNPANEHEYLYDRVLRWMLSLMTPNFHSNHLMYCKNKNHFFFSN